MMVPPMRWMVGMLPRADQTSLASGRLGDLQALLEIGVPQRHRVLVVAVDDLAERHAEFVLVAHKLDAVLDVRQLLAEGADAGEAARGPLHEGGSSGPNRSSRALAKPPRSLVLSAEPATMKELPNAPLWLVLP